MFSTGEHESPPTSVRDPADGIIRPRMPTKAPTHLDNEEHVVGFSGIQAIDDVSASLASPNGKRATFRYGIGEDFIV